MQSDWRAEAACHDMDPDIFFPGPHPHAPRAALAVCARCPSRDDCLAEALTAQRCHAAWPGVWGGTTETQRDDIIRRGLREAS